MLLFSNTQFQQLIKIYKFFFYNLDEDKWKTEAKTEEGAVQEYTISYQNLVPESTYLFRVIAYNKYSISYPAESQDEVNAKYIRCKFFSALMNELIIL